MSENEQEVVPVKISEIGGVYTDLSGDKYAIHVIMNDPPEPSFGYCFRTAGKWIGACSIYSLIGWIVGSILYAIFK